MSKYKYEDYYMRSTFKKILYLSLGWLAFLSKITPKKKGLHVFGSMNGYAVADNSKYLYEQSTGKKYFITKNKSILNEPLSDGRFPIYAYSVRGFFLQLFAEKSFYTHGTYDLVPPLIWGSEKNNLWHGVPLKDIGPKSNWKHDSDFKRKFKFIYYNVFRYTYYMACDKVYCPFHDRVGDYKDYFSISNPEVIVRVQPRNAVVNVNVSSNKVLYAPTFKSWHFKNFDYYSHFVKIGLYNDDLNDFLTKKSLKLVIRLHPIDNLLLSDVPLPNNVSVDNTIDVYESLHKYKLIITDYSSIYFDCLERGSRCCFIAPELDDYEKSVGLNEFLYNKIKSDNNISLLDAIASFDKEQAAIS